MKASNGDNTKTRRPRPAQTGELVGVRLQPEALQRIDEWRRRQDDPPNRPEAIRRLVEIGLAAKGKPR